MPVLNKQSLLSPDFLEQFDPTDAAGDTTVAVAVFVIDNPAATDHNLITFSTRPSPDTDIYIPEHPCYVLTSVRSDSVRMEPPRVVLRPGESEEAAAARALCEALQLPQVDSVDELLGHEESRWVRFREHDANQALLVRCISMDQWKTLLAVSGPPRPDSIMTGLLPLFTEDNHTRKYCFRQYARHVLGSLAWLLLAAQVGLGHDLVPHLGLSSQFWDKKLRKTVCLLGDNVGWFEVKSSILQTEIASPSLAGFSMLADALRFKLAPSDN
jgi:hypothetical protein